VNVLPATWTTRPCGCTVTAGDPTDPANLIACQWHAHLTIRATWDAPGTHPRVTVLRDVETGVRRAEAIHGHDRHLADGTGRDGDDATATLARAVCDRAFALGQGTWRHVVDEEWAEACAETDPARLRAELIDTMAALTCWVEDIDREQAAP